MSTFKQVVVVRSDLKMGKGKLAVQVAHAAVSSAEETRRSHNSWLKNWLLESQPKICVKVENEKELWLLKTKLDDDGLPNAIIHDAGLTQLDPGTTTCLGIGPLPTEIVDRYTSNLKLL